MQFIKTKLLLVAGATVFLGACSSFPGYIGSSCSTAKPCSKDQKPNIIVESAQPERKETHIIDVVPRDPIIVRTTGYSAPVESSSFSKAQARLLTMRGSKLDAYRNLAERVYGLDINSSSSVNNMVTQYDEIRAYVDAYLVGAKVVSQRELKDGTFETVVELALKEDFRQCVSSVEAIRSNPHCLTKNNYRTSAPMPSPKPQRPSSFYSVQ